MKVRRESERMTAPGISDNGTGLAALVAWPARSTNPKIKPQRTILFVADVGEEGEGNLRGMRALVDTYRSKLKAAIVLDGSGTDHVTTKALASRRLEVLITGPGGHSWSDFGMPNPINALVRASVRFINTRVPASPRTTFNLGQIEGGTSINSVPHEARLKVDIRSESEDELIKLESALRDCVAAGVRDEMESPRDRSKGKLEWKVELLGSRPVVNSQPTLRCSPRFALRINTSAINRGLSAPPPTPTSRSQLASTPSPSAQAAPAAARTPSRNGTSRLAARWASSALFLLFSELPESRRKNPDECRTPPGTQPQHTITRRPSASRRGFRY